MTTPVRCFIGIGSNLQNPAQQVAQAIRHIQAIPNTEFLGHSPWYQSLAVGPGEQPDYLNGVAMVDTYLPPDELLSALLEIEQSQGRIRTERWAARSLDLDILLYGDEIVSTDRLQIPHPRLQERNFVLYPLADLAPQLVLPCGKHLQDLVATVSSHGITPAEPGLVKS